MCQCQPGPEYWLSHCPHPCLLGVGGPARAGSEQDQPSNASYTSTFSERENLKRFQGQHPPLTPIDSMLKMPSSFSQSPSSKYPGVSAPFVAGRSVLELRGSRLETISLL